MTLKLEWTQQETFASQPLREWFVDGEVAGKTRRAGPLTYATIKDAGHLVRQLRVCRPSEKWLCHDLPRAAEICGDIPWQIQS